MLISLFVMYKVIFLHLIVIELNVTCKYNVLGSADKEIRRVEDKVNFYLLIYF